MFSERVRAYLLDIVEDADRLAGFINGATLQSFTDDERTVLAVERLFQRITEAVIRVGPEDMTRVGTDIPVDRIRAFGNRLRHDYRNIDPRVLLDTAANDLPLLRDAVARALAT
jgi:uncharacterized protein with HEPN domain